MEMKEVFNRSIYGVLSRLSDNELNTFTLDGINFSQMVVDNLQKIKANREESIKNTTERFKNRYYIQFNDGGIRLYDITPMDENKLFKFHMLVINTNPQEMFMCERKEVYKAIEVELSLCNDYDDLIECSEEDFNELVQVYASTQEFVKEPISKIHKKYGNRI